MNKPTMRRTRVKAVVALPRREATLVPVFRYGDESTHGRTWLWLTGAAVLVVVAASLLLPQVI